MNDVGKQIIDLERRNYLTGENVKSKIENLLDISLKEYIK